MSKAQELRENVARAIWNVMREYEDRCDMELEDMGEKHHVWEIAEAAIAASSEQQAAQQDAKGQPRLTVRLTSFPESNGKRNWTALLVRDEKWGGLIGNAGGITVARGELWNRVAYESERARFLLGLRDTEPFILDYGDDIETPEEWKGETRLAARASNGGKA